MPFSRQLQNLSIKKEHGDVEDSKLYKREYCMAVDENVDEIRHQLESISNNETNSN